MRQAQGAAPDLSAVLVAHHGPTATGETELARPIRIEAAPDQIDANHTAAN